MLKFRKINYDTDIKEIVQLLKNNLDPNFTREHFIWKHKDNPFGESYGLVALEGGRIIGLRMFMYWEFLEGSEKGRIKAIRPVDTVVDAEYRGRGLFKKLTLEGLQNCKNKYKFVFNTPNQNSLPGYLKMGWKKYEHPHYFKIGLLNPFYSFSKISQINLEDVAKEDLPVPSKGSIRTNNSLEYLRWRYYDSSLYKVAFFPNDQVTLIYGIRRFYFIIYEVFGENSLTINMLNAIGKKTGKFLFYYYENQDLKNIRSLSSIKREQAEIVIKDWDVQSCELVEFSLADLEARF